MPPQRFDAAFGRRAMLLGGLAAGTGALAACGSKTPAGTSAVALPTPSVNSPSPSPLLPVADTLVHPPTRFGLNYTPSRVWWDLWQSFDAKRVNHDFAQIASLGVDHIRVQLLWSVFQPTAKGADPAMLEKLHTMLELADKHDLDVCTSVITASLSGLYFVPDWANGRDWISTPALVDAQVDYIRDLGRAVGSHKRLLGFDLGNENLGQAPDRSAAHLRNWATTLIHASHKYAPGKIHTVSPNGVFSVPFPDIVASVGALSVIHPWCFIEGSVSKTGEVGFATGHHAEFNVQHIRSFHAFDAGPRRRVWVQEIGAPQVNFYRRRVIPPQYAAEWIEFTVRNLLTSEDLWGITWWCSHEIDPVLHKGRFHPPEYTLGLFDYRGRLKPGGRRFAAMIDDYQAGRLAGPVARPMAVVGSRAPVFNTVESTGSPAAIVQPDRINDAAYLARRGITTLIH